MPAPPTAKRIEMWPLERLRPYERNARTHSPEQVAQIVASIQEFGFTNPLLVDGADGILAGHGRLAAAKDMGLAEVPVIVLDHLSAAQRRAYILADNQLALNAGWDAELLQAEVMALNLADFDLSLLGFDEDRIAELLDPESIDREGDLSPGVAGSDRMPQGAGDSDDVSPPAKLADRFGIPPFTVLNAREGWWQERKRHWQALGIQSELGRGGGMTWGVNPDYSTTRRQEAA
jgi:hypothetical protein